MSKEDIQKFREAVHSDESIRESTLNLEMDEDSGWDPLISLAQAHGYHFTAEELQQVGIDTELTEEELEWVSGGFSGQNCSHG